MSEEKKKEEKTDVAVWKPQQKFPGTDLTPALTSGKIAEAEPVGGLVGRENVDPEDLILPSLLLLQGQSDAVTQGEEDAKPGVFWSPTAAQAFKPPLRVLIVHHSRSRALFPREGDEDLKKCISRDGLEGTEYGSCEECEYRKWGPQNEKPLCSESHNFVVWTPQGPAILRFAKTSFKAARNFITTWTMSRKNLWAHLATVTVKQNQKTMRDGKQTTYYTMDLRWDQREDVPPAFQENAVELYQQIQQAHEAGKFSSEMDTEDLRE